MAEITIKQLTSIILKQTKEKGFGDKLEDINVMENIALIHSEISEAMEAYRHKNIDGQDGLAEELADAIIRILHLAGVYNINIEKEILKKIESNKSREWDWEKMNEGHS